MAEKFTLIIPFYDNAEMLRLQYRLWRKWKPELKDRWRIILVDDGSPVPALDVERPDGLPELQIYRVLEDRPWHQHAARNLGADQAPEGWMLMTDMDHVIDKRNAARLVKMLDDDRLINGLVYMLERREADTGELTIGNTGLPKPHPNSFVLTRQTYWRVGGYDEDYCGVYGTDGLFRRRIQQRAYLGHLKNICLMRYSRDMVEDASTRTLARKEGRDPGAKQAVAERKREEGRENKIVTLNFPWERVL